MSAAFGVYLGSTTASFAVCRDGKADVIANDAGDRVTPAVVAFTDHDQAVGLAAKHGIIRNASNTVMHVKETLGQSYKDVKPMVDKSNVKNLNEGEKRANIVKPIMLEKNGGVVYDVEYQEKRTTFTPEQIAALIYKSLMETANFHGDEGETHDTVLAVPVNYTEQQKNAFKAAATSVGFHVMRVMNEPSAALLAYDIGQGEAKDTCNVLVYKLGGTSLDVTIYSVVGGMYRLTASSRDTSLGGHIIDDLLIDHFAEDFSRQWKQDCKSNAKSRGKLRNAAETCKHIMSNMATAQSYIESLFDGIDFLCKISRGRFDALCSNFFSQCIEPLNKILQDSQLTKQDIHKVILCGGTTKMPMLQQKLKDYFTTAEILSSILPDEVIAAGAAKQASLLSGSEPEELKYSETQNELPCLTHDIVVQTADKPVTILHRYTAIPTRKQHKFLLNPEQGSFCMKIGAKQNKAETLPLAQICMTELPQGCQVLGVFHLRSDGSLHITCTEPTTNAHKDVTIEPAS